MKFRLVIKTEVEIPFDPQRYPPGSEPSEALAFEVQEAFFLAIDSCEGATEVVGRLILDESELSPPVDRVVRRGPGRVWRTPGSPPPQRRRASRPA